MMKLKRVLLWIWQLPQHVLGMLLILITKASYIEKSDIWECKKFICSWGVSLGNYRVFSNTVPSIYSIKHEEGHSVQSRYLGPLYLIVVGLLSFIRNIYGRAFKKNMIYNEYYRWYYSQFPENWADHLGHVNRFQTVGGINVT